MHISVDFTRVPRATGAKFINLSEVGSAHRKEENSDLTFLLTLHINISYHINQLATRGSAFYFSTLVTDNKEEWSNAVLCVILQTVWNTAANETAFLFLVCATKALLLHVRKKAKCSLSFKAITKTIFSKMLLWKYFYNPQWTQYSICCVVSTCLPSCATLFWSKQ